jgi:predicted ATPase
VCSFHRPSGAAGLADIHSTLVDRYSVERSLGVGGMSEVFAARDLRHDRPVAIKVVRHDVTAPRVAERFEREVRIAARLQHPHIVPLFDSGAAEDARYYVMPLVDGPSLRSRLEAGPPLTLEEVIQIATEVAGALDYAHAHGIVHRDIKPENILLSGGHALVADFGIARPAVDTLDSSTLTQGFAVGTPAYMSPEQAAGERALDGRSDQYALACVVFELLAGRPPFRAATAQGIISKHFLEAVPPLPLAPPVPSRALDQVLGRALAKEPAARFATTGDFASALRAASRRSAESDPSGLAFGSSGAGIPVAAPIIGREEAVADAISLLRRSDVRLVTFTGPGGSGKTRLAIEVSARAHNDFPAGVSFVALGPVADTGAVPTAIAQALGIRATDPAAVAEEIARRSNHRRALLVLDDFERHVSAAPWVAELLAAAPGLTVLVTSRVRLRVRVEHEFPVPPLELPELSTDAGRDPSTYASVQLFAQRARAVDPSFTLTDENIRPVAEICARLDGLPLAIELAAARVRLLPPGAMVRRLDNRLRLLTGGSRDLPARQQTIRRTIDWSYDLLSEPERRLFARLAVFAGSFSVDAAERVCDPDGAVGLDVLDGLAALSDASLLSRDTRHRDGEARLRMLETVREFALQQLERDPGADFVRDCHRDWYLELAQRAAPRLAGEQVDRWVSALAMEHANINAALARSVQAGDVARALAFGAALWRYWLVHGDLLEGRGWLDRILALAVPESFAAARADALTGAATLAHNLGYLDEARRHCLGALELRRSLGDDAGAARALADLGWITWLSCDFAEARRISHESLELATRAGDRRGMAQALSTIGWAFLFEGDLESARDAYQRCLAIRRELADRRGIAIMIWLLGWTAGRAGDHARGFELLEEALPAFRAVGDIRLYAYVLATLAEVSLDAGDIRRAQSALESEALPLFRRTDDRWGLAHVLILLSQVSRERQELDRAESLARESQEICRAIHDRYGVAQCLAALAEVARARRDEATSRSLYAESLEIRKAIGDRRGIEECERALASGEVPTRA